MIARNCCVSETSGLSLSLLVSWVFLHGHKMAAMVLDIVSKPTKGRKEKERKGKGQNNCIISFDKENNVFQSSPSYFATCASFAQTGSHNHPWLQE